MPRPITSQVCAPSISSHTRTQRVQRMQRLWSCTKRSCVASTVQLGIAVRQVHVRHAQLLRHAPAVRSGRWTRRPSRRGCARRRAAPRSAAVLLQPLGVGGTSMPSATRVTQAGKSLGVPLTSTRHSRQAPMSVRPSRWQSVGMSIPFSRATSRIGLVVAGADSPCRRSSA